MIVMVFQLQTNSPSKLKKSWFFKNIFFLYEFLSKIQIGFDYHRTWWYQFFRYFLCKIFSPEISCDFDLSSSRSSLRSLAENMKRYMVLVVQHMFYSICLGNIISKKFFASDSKMHFPLSVIKLIAKNTLINTRLHNFKIEVNLDEVKDLNTKKKSKMQSVLCSSIWKLMSLF